MAYITNDQVAERPGLFARIFDALMKAAESSARVREIEILQAKTDEELAEMGLRREDIARLVFRDIYFV